jgi:cation:H+ antiporter
MLTLDLLWLIVALFVLIKSADYGIKYSSRLARMFHLSEFLVSFFVVAFISVLPEATVGVISSLQGVPELGLSTLLGSNVADLTIVFGIITLFSVSGIHVKSKILKKDYFYLILLLFPVIMGFDGHYSRNDGAVLILSGLLFFLTLSIENHMFSRDMSHLRTRHFWTTLLLLLASVAVLLASAYYTVRYGVLTAQAFHVPASVIGVTVLSLGVCLPELTFGIRAIRLNHDSLALGDILGTVITDATILVGVMAIIRPFSFDPAIAYVTGLSMFFAAILVTAFMQAGQVLTKKEGVVLIFFYVITLFATMMFA